MLPVSRTGGQFLMSTVAVASLERSSLQMTAVVITQAEWLTCTENRSGVRFWTGLFVLSLQPPPP